MMKTCVAACGFPPSSERARDSTATSRADECGWRWMRRRPVGNWCCGLSSCAAALWRLCTRLAAAHSDGRGRGPLLPRAAAPAGTVAAAAACLREARQQQQQQRHQHAVTTTVHAWRRPDGAKVFPAKAKALPAAPLGRRHLSYPSLHRFQSPQGVNNYLKLRRLGTGSFSRVVLYRREEGGSGGPREEVAIKAGCLHLTLLFSGSP